MKSIRTIRTSAFRGTMPRSIVDNSSLNIAAPAETIGRTRVSRILKKLEHQCLKPALRRIWPWRHKNLNGIRVNYMHHLVGGGYDFGQEYIPYLRNRGMPRQARTFEWCAGPAFIGFSMLGAGLTESLCLADINPEAVAVCRRTIKDNALSSRVDVYVSDNLASISASEHWDLVVGNPPHYPDEFIGQLRAHDPDWRIHRTFFAQVGAHLKSGGVIVLQENSQGSTAETFGDMISQAGLEIIFVEFGPRRRTPHGHIYYIGIMRQGDAVPTWAKSTICA
jgi:predicted RNA methylase